MNVYTIETFQFGEKYFVLLKTAAKYLYTSPNMLLEQGLLGELKVVKIGVRQFIELEALKAYAESKNLSTEGWSVIAATRGRGGIG